MLVQPIAAREVAGALAELVTGPPVGMAREMAGPERHQFTDLVRAVRTARGSRKLLVTLRVPGAAGKAMAGGALLPTGDGPRGSQTFEEWLAATSSSPAESSDPR
jgi:uncharacterized protein YbjT (DUF2867 family)